MTHLNTQDLEARLQELVNEGRGAFANEAILLAHALLRTDRVNSLGELWADEVYYKRKNEGVQVFIRGEDNYEWRATYTSDQIRGMASASAAQQAAPNNAFDLSSMMAATAKPIDDGRTVPDGSTATANAAPAPIPAAQTPTPSAAPAFRKGPDFSAAPKQADVSKDAKSSAPFPAHRGPDFSTAPAKKKPEDEKLTSKTPIIQLNDFDIKPKLATDEIARRGAGVAVARKAYQIDGKEIEARYEFTKGGKVLHTGFDGKQTEMTFEQAKRHEISEINQLNRNAIMAINRMATDPNFTVRQGDSTYSVKGDFFLRTKDDGKVTKEPLADTRKRFEERGREINAMGGKEPTPLAEPMQTVQPKPEKKAEFSRMADRAEAAAIPDTASGKTLDTGHQMGA